MDSDDSEISSSTPSAFKMDPAAYDDDTDTIHDEVPSGKLIRRALIIDQEESAKAAPETHSREAANRALRTEAPWREKRLLEESKHRLESRNLTLQSELLLARKKIDDLECLNRRLLASGIGAEEDAATAIAGKAGPQRAVGAEPDASRRSGCQDTGSGSPREDVRASLADARRTIANLEAEMERMAWEEVRKKADIAVLHERVVEAERQLNESLATRAAARFSQDMRNGRRQSLCSTLCSCLWPRSRYHVVHVPSSTHGRGGADIAAASGGSGRSSMGGIGRNSMGGIGDIGGGFGSFRVGADPA
ncbi:unnamed protein product [Phaeothamnion confervicola]